jgi:hypothetical protein
MTAVCSPHSRTGAAARGSGSITPCRQRDRAADLGYGTLALTNHDNLYGAMESAHDNATLCQMITDLEDCSGASVPVYAVSHGQSMCTYIRVLGR